MNRTISEANEPIFHVENLSIRLAGNHMEKQDGYNLSYVLTALGSLERAAKKTYLYNKGTTRFSKDDEQNFSVRLMDVKEGSFISDLQVIYSDTIIPLLPVVIENREIIWNSLKTTYNFLKAKISAAKEGKTVEIIQTTDTGGSNINLNQISDSHIEIKVYPGIPELAEKLAPEYASLTSIVDGDKVESIELKDDEDNALLISHDDQQLFSKSTYTEDSIFSIRGKIVDGEFTKLRGQIQIIEANTNLIEVGGIYKFKVNDNLNAEEKWREMFLEEKPYYCKKRIEINPMETSIAKVIEIIIVEWDEQSWTT